MLSNPLPLHPFRSVPWTLSRESSPWELLIGDDDDNFTWVEYSEVLQKLTTAQTRLNFSLAGLKKKYQFTLIRTRVPFILYTEASFWGNFFEGNFKKYLNPILLKLAPYKQHKFPINTAWEEIKSNSKYVMWVAIKVTWFKGKKYSTGEVCQNPERNCQPAWELWAWGAEALLRSTASISEKQLGTRHILRHTQKVQVQETVIVASSEKLKNSLEKGDNMLRKNVLVSSIGCFNCKSRTSPKIELKS